MRKFWLSLLAGATLAGMTFLPNFAWSQPEQTTPPDIRLELMPVVFVDGMPDKFVVVLTNISGGDIRIPPPEIDCSNPSSNGSLWLQWIFMPVSGDGIGPGISSCGPRGSVYPLPALTVGNLTRTWVLLHPAQSLRIPANSPAGSGFSVSGTYTVSAKYIPPQLSREAERLLSIAGIIIPRQGAETSEQRYVRP